MKTSSSSNRRKLYTDYAWLWDVTSPVRDYKEGSGYLVKVIKENSQIDVNDVLHLGCGSGGLDYYLKKRFNITGVDLAAPMLEIARKRNPEAEYFQGDMRKVRLKKRFDAVLVPDSIDYMLNEADIRAVFDTGYFHLRPGGVMIALVGYDKERFPQNKTYTQEVKYAGLDVVFIENNYDPDPSDNTFEAVFIFLVRDKGELKLFQDKHLVGLFTNKVWISQMEATGFEVKHEKIKFIVYDEPYDFLTLVGRMI